MPDQLPQTEQSPETAIAEQIDAAYDLIFARELPEADTLLAVAEAQSQGLGLRRQLIRSIYWRSYILTLRGEHFSAEQRLREALELARHEASDGLIAGLHFALARIYHMRGQLGNAEDELGLALMHANNSGDKRRQADTYALLGICRRNQGLLDDAYDYISTACALFKELPHEEHAATETLLDLSDIAFELGRDDLAAEVFAEAMGLDSGQIHTRLMSRGHQQRAAQRLLLGDLPGAQAELRQAAALAGEVLDYESQLDLELASGKYLHAVGDYAAAAQHFVNATRMAQNTQSRFRLAEVRLERARTLMAQGEPEKAHAVLSDAEVAFEMFGAQQHLARACCILARFRVLEGREGAARVALSRARALVAGVGQPVGRTLEAELRAADAELAAAAAAVA